MESMRLLLKSHVTRGEIEYMALDYEWKIYSAERIGEFGSSYRVWLDGEDEYQTVIIYTEDDFAGHRYISVDGIDSKSVVEKIRASVDTYTREEIGNCIASANRHDEWIQAIRMVGVSLSHAFDPWGFQVLCNGLEHQDPRVRLAAIAAIGFPAWIEFVEPLNRVQEKDADLRVLRRAARMMDLLQNAGTPSADSPDLTSR
jgi:hypothetical protein